MTTIVPPTERACERCARQEVWDGDRETWVIATVDGEKRVGRKYCIHEWDINGTYNPVQA
ncbi:HEWD family protein [Natronomonas sp. EA1]|uniref:HEWD family protein n=1 Tax=Natronomonas sp. EA1 TaxID=3421655 RepID=UPI003EBC81AB